MRWAGKDLVPPSDGEILATRDLQNITATAILTAPEKLFREQRQQTLWLSALLAVALLAVLSAFLALQKSLASERVLNQQKSDFVASVSHELRAPVSSLRLMLENLQNGATVAEPARAEYLKLMEGECRRLSALIENVLDFARIEAGREVFVATCAACHGENAEGNREVGAPNLTDPYWVYGGSMDTIIASVHGGRMGHMPTWDERLTAGEIRTLAVYVHDMGTQQP